MYTKMFIRVIVLVMVIAAIVKIGNSAFHSMQREGRRIDACIFNPDYQGSTPEATRYLYDQCKANH